MLAVTDRIPNRNLDQKPQLLPAAGSGRSVEAPPLDLNWKPAEVDPFVLEFRQFLANCPEPDDKRVRREYLKDRWKVVVGSWESRGLDSVDERVMNGEILPDEVIQIIKEGRYENDNIPLYEDEEDIVNGRWLAALATALSYEDATGLVEMLEERAGRVPLDLEDVAIFYAGLHGVAEINHGTNQSFLEDWEKLSGARNPLYRMLALRASRSAVSVKHANISMEDPDYNKITAPERLRFYKNYLNQETDPAILQEAILLVGFIDDVAARPVLDRIRLKNAELGNIEIVATAESALRSLENILD